MLSMTYGQLPTRPVFDAAWDSTVAKGEMRNGLFHFSNDWRLGNGAYSRDQLWEELNKAIAEYNLPEDGPDAASSCFISDTGDWIACVLNCIGIEWI